MATWVAAVLNHINSKLNSGRSPVWTLSANARRYELQGTLRVTRWVDLVVTVRGRCSCRSPQLSSGRGSDRPCRWLNSLCGQYCRYQRLAGRRNSRWWRSNEPSVNVPLARILHRGSTNIDVPFSTLLPCGKRHARGLRSLASNCRWFRLVRWNSRRQGRNCVHRHRWVWKCRWRSQSLMANTPSSYCRVNVSLQSAIFPT